LNFLSLEDSIEEQNPVRVIDAFVNAIDLTQVGVETKTLKSEGRPPFKAEVFLKLYFYGYLNGIRSSRRLERECTRNIELQWLLEKRKPNYHSIADFRKNNAKAIKAVFKLFVLFLKEESLIEGKIVASDGTKVRAQNSRKNNFSESKINRHLIYIENKTQEYLSELDANDETEKSPEKIKSVKEKLERLRKHKIKYEQLQEDLSASGETQISTTDKDSKALLVYGQVVEVSYNVQTSTDEKNKLIAAYQTTNKNDRNALSKIALEAKVCLDVNSLLTINDKGYYNGREIQICEENNITTIVAYPQIVNSNKNGTQPEYVVDHFIYNKEKDTYTCPQGETLTTKGTWHTKKRENFSNRFKKYRTAKCASCVVKNLCTGRQKGGREIERSEFADAAERNDDRYNTQQDLYKKRQTICEHPFGTIKRQWGYNFTLLRGLKKVEGEMGLIFTVYNLKRAINIIGTEELIAKLKKWKPKYRKVARHPTKTTDLIDFCVTKNFEMKLAA
jgi:transposase